MRIHKIKVGQLFRKVVDGKLESFVVSPWGITKLDINKVTEETVQQLNCCLHLLKGEDIVITK